MDVIKLDCLVIGAGVAGLAIARELSFQLKNVFIIEKNLHIGEEVSSRNSEVIHAGIYYKNGSFKHRLVEQGKPLLYEFLAQNKVPFKKCGKYIISTSELETKKLDLIKENAEASGLADLFFDTENFKKTYPFVKADKAIFSPSTGIMDSHTYLNQLKYGLEANGGFAFMNNQCLEVNTKDGKIEILVCDKASGSIYKIRTSLLINCGGIFAAKLQNMFPQNTVSHNNRYVKGEYYSYTGTEVIDHLIYPIPENDGLGIHVTMDLGGQIRFGPSSYTVDTIDYSIDLSRKFDFVNSIRSYWPNINPDLLHPSYSGIRPKLTNSDDFKILKTEVNSNIFLSVLGYDSPGLTASLGLAKYVKSLLQ